MSRKLKVSDEYAELLKKAACQGPFHCGGIADPHSSCPTTWIYGPAAPGMQSGRQVASQVPTDVAPLFEAATELLSDRETMLAEIKRLREALDRIAQGKDAPDLYAGQMRTGLRCGVEDRNIVCRYESAEYGWDDAAERFLEWANNEARAALEHGEAKESA